MKKISKLLLVSAFPLVITSSEVDKLENLSFEDAVRAIKATSHESEDLNDFLEAAQKSYANSSDLDDLALLFHKLLDQKKDPIFIKLIADVFDKAVERRKTKEALKAWQLLEGGNKAEFSPILDAITKIDDKGLDVSLNSFSDAFNSLNRLSQEEKKNPLLIAFLEDFIRDWSKGSGEKVLEFTHKLDKIGIYLDDDNILQESSEYTEKIDEIVDLAQDGEDQEALEATKELLNELIDKIEDGEQSVEQMQIIKEAVGRLVPIVPIGSPLQQLVEESAAEAQKKLVESFIKDLKDPNNQHEVLQKLHELNKQGIYLDDDTLLEELEKAKLSAEDVIEVVADAGAPIVSAEELQLVVRANPQEIAPVVNELVYNIEVAAQSGQARVFIPELEAILAAERVLLAAGKEEQAGHLKEVALESVAQLVAINPAAKAQVDAVLEEVTHSPVYGLILKIVKAGRVVTQQKLQEIFNDLKNLTPKDKKSPILIGFLENYVKNYAAGNASKLLDVVHLLNKVGIYLNDDHLLPDEKHKDLSSEVEEVIEESRSGNAAGALVLARKVVNKLVGNFATTSEEAKNQSEVVNRTLEAFKNAGIDLSKIRFTLSPEQQAQLTLLGQQLANYIKQGNDQAFTKEVGFLVEKVKSLKMLGAPEAADKIGDVLKEAGEELADTHNLDALDLLVDIAGAGSSQENTIAAAEQIQEASEDILSSQKAAHVDSLEKITKAIQVAHHILPQSKKTPELVQQTVALVDVLPDSPQKQELLKELTAINEVAATQGVVESRIKRVKNAFQVIKEYAEGGTQTDAEVHLAVEAIGNLADIKPAQLDSNLKKELQDARDEVAALRAELEKLKSERAQEVLKELPAGVDAGTQTVAEKVAQAEQAVQVIRDYVDSGTQSSPESVSVALDAIQQVEEVKPSEVEDSLRGELAGAKQRLNDLYDELSALSRNLEEEKAARERAEKVVQELTKVGVEAGTQTVAEKVAQAEQAVQSVERSFADGSMNTELETRAVGMVVNLSYQRAEIYSEKLFNAARKALAAANKQIADLKRQLETSSAVNFAKLAEKAAEAVKLAASADSLRLDLEKQIAGKADLAGKYEELIAASAAKDAEIRQFRKDLDSLRAELEAKSKVKDMSEAEQQTLETAVAEIATQVSPVVEQQIAEVQAAVRTAEGATQTEDLAIGLEVVTDTLNSIISSALSQAQREQLVEELQAVDELAEKAKEEGIVNEVIAVENAVSAIRENLEPSVPSRATTDTQLTQKADRLYKDLRNWKSKSFKRVGAIKELLELVHRYEVLVSDNASGVDKVSSLLRDILRNDYLSEKTIRLIIGNNRASAGCRGSSLRQANRDFVTLKNLGVNLNKQWGRGMTKNYALMYAVRVGCSGIVKSLLDLGANKNAKGSTGLNALQFAKYLARMSPSNKELAKIVKLLS